MHSKTNTEKDTALSAIRIRKSMHSKSLSEVRPRGSDRLGLTHETPSLRSMLQGSS